MSSFAIYDEIAVILCDICLAAKLGYLVAPHKYKKPQGRLHNEPAVSL